MATKKQMDEWNDYNWNKRVQSSVGRNIKDVVTGKAAWEGLKVIGRGLTSNIRRSEERHKKINGYK